MAMDVSRILQSSLRRAAVDVEPCDVFISHRGADTKHGLVGHLNARLRRANVQAFMDEFGLKAGDSAWKTMQVRSMADLACCLKDKMPC